MALSIKSEEADRLARELAALTDESLTDVVIIALRERLLNIRRMSSESTKQRLLRLASDVKRLPVIDSRTHAEIIGYDDLGLPQ